VALKTVAKVIKNKSAEIISTFIVIFIMLVIVASLMYYIGCHEKMGFPNFNGGTIEITQTKKGGPNKWYHKNLQKAIL